MGWYEGIFVKRNKYYILLIVNVLCSCLLFKFAYLFQHKFNQLVGIASFLTWHSIFEIFSVVVSFAVFLYAITPIIRPKASGLCF